MEEQMSPHHVLVVDADPMSRALVEDVLGGRSVRVWGVENVHVALEVIEAGAPDVVLLDAQEGAADERAFGTFLDGHFGRHIPVIVLAPQSAAEGLVSQLGADNWLAKPLDANRLRARVAAYLA
jgi:CheY-like chemotaxis protein